MIRASDSHSKSRQANLLQVPECAWPFSRHAACSSACDEPGKPRYARFIPSLRPYARAYAHRPRALIGLREQMGRIGTLEVRLANCRGWFARLKSSLPGFLPRGPALPSPARLLARRDIDRYDAICDHLLVIDHAAHARSALNRPTVVGTYRLLRQPLAEQYGGFLHAASLIISGLVARHSVCNSLSSAGLAYFSTYRNKRTVELLWLGIHAYFLQTNAM